jgi:pimeloyl-ACP methyl ester carboxylesterase
MSVLALSAAAPGRPGVSGCVPGGADVVHLRGGSTPLASVMFGRGRRGVVFSNESDRDLCSWAPFARRLAGSGFRVALYDYSGASPVSDLTAVAGALRRSGATSIALVGASEGAKTSIVAAARIHPAAIVSISAERLLRGYGDVLPSARALRSPIFYLYAEADPFASPSTPELYHATRETAKRLLRLPGSDHGTALLAHPTVPPLIESFLADHLAARRTASVSVAPLPSLSKRCGTPAGGTTFWFRTADGARLDGAVLGSGTRGVVLATEFPRDLCSWLPEALVLRKRGLRVLLFDFRGFGLSTAPARASARRAFAGDVVAAARELRSRGASRIYLVGASLGGTASIVAAARIRPAVAGVVSLSGEANLNGIIADTGLDAAAVAPRLHVPVLYLASKDDGLTPPGDVARMRAALRSRGSRVVVYPDGYHGWDLLYLAPYRARVERVIESFLR